MNEHVHERSRTVDLILITPALFLPLNVTHAHIYCERRQWIPTIASNTSLRPQVLRLKNTSVVLSCPSSASCSVPLSLRSWLHASRSSIQWLCVAWRTFEAEEVELLSTTNWRVKFTGGSKAFGLGSRTDADHLGRRVSHNGVSDTGYPPPRRVRPHGPSLASRISTIALSPS